MFLLVGIYVTVFIKEPIFTPITGAISILVYCGVICFGLKL